jgi:Trehalase
MRFPELSRRRFLKTSAIAGGAARLVGLVPVGYGDLPVAFSQAAAVQPPDDKVQMTSPANGDVLPSTLTAKLRWEYAERVMILADGTRLPYWNYLSLNLKVSPNEDMSNPLTDVDLPDHITNWCLAVSPNHKYFWQIIPRDEKGDHPDLGFKATFTSGEPQIDETTDSSVRYKNPRSGAHFRSMKPVRFAQYEPLSPWYDVRSYNSPPPPRFEDIKDKFPIPVFDGHPDALETYWYCWKTLLDVWYCAPDALDHQAVANVNCSRSWDAWGSSQVFDSAYMMYFAKYGHQAYPFINQYDNAYARQHENGFVCRESDLNNREVYSSHPALAPFLMGWAEWKYYQVSGDVQRLRRVLLPITANYEWWMTYMRRKDGLYWKQGLTNEERLTFGGDDTLDYAIGNNATRAAEALHIAKIAAVVGRPDLAEFFSTEHKTIGQIVNDRLWDAKHGIYNDRCDPEHPVLKYNDPKQAGEFVTEIKPGIINKRVETLLPLFGEIVPQERIEPVLQELRNPNSFNRPNGIPSLSADSAGYDRAGTAWPLYQCMVQEGLRAHGEFELARELAEKYVNAVVATFRLERTIKESILADKLQFSGASEFVGWGGVGPIANFIEYILGFELNVPDKTITWRISRTEKHGLRNLKFGDFYVELICEERQSQKEPFHITISSGGPFVVRIITQRGNIVRKIEEGTAVIQDT